MCFSRENRDVFLADSAVIRWSGTKAKATGLTHPLDRTPEPFSLIVIPGVSFSERAPMPPQNQLSTSARADQQQGKDDGTTRARNR